MGSNRLPVLAQNIRTHHQAALDAAAAATRHAITCGEMLIEAKKELKHGKWLPWLRDNCDISERTAQAYMRVAREVSKLDPAEAQRVADLSYRQALDHVAGGAAAMKEMDAAERNAVIERAENSSKPIKAIVVETEKNRQRDVEFAVPKAILPSEGERQVGVLGHDGNRQICVVIGPNVSGVRLEENLAALRQSYGYQEREAEIATMQGRVAELRAKAEKLDRQAATLSAELTAWVKARLLADHGPANHFIETYDYQLSESAWAAIAALEKETEAAAYVRAHPDECRILKRGWWGDVRLIPYSMNGPHQGASGGSGFDGIGSPGWLHEMFPDGLRPKEADDGPRDRAGT